MDSMKHTTIFAFAAIVCGAIFAGSETPVNIWPEGKMPSPQENQKYAPYLVWHNPENPTSTAILISVSGGGYMGNGIEGFEVSPIRD